MGTSGLRRHFGSFYQFWRGTRRPIHCGYFNGTQQAWIKCIIIITVKNILTIDNNLLHLYVITIGVTYSRSFSFFAWGLDWRRCGHGIIKLHPHAPRDANFAFALVRVDHGVTLNQGCVQQIHVLLGDVEDLSETPDDGGCVVGVHVLPLLDPLLLLILHALLINVQRLKCFMECFINKIINFTGLFFKLSFFLLLFLFNFFSSVTRFSLSLVSFLVYFLPLIHSSTLTTRT